MSQLLLLADSELESTIAVVVVGAYAFLIVVALLLKAFRSWIGLVVAFVFSAMASLPAASAVSLFLKSPSHLNRQSVTGKLLTAAVILIFVWTAPVLQYFLIRLKRRSHPKE